MNILQIIGTTSTGKGRAEIAPFVPNLDIVSGGIAEEGSLEDETPYFLQ